MVDLDPEYLAKVNPYIEQSTILRGQVLVNCTEVESIIGDIIGFHFFPKKDKERSKRVSLTALLINESRLPFRTKITLFTKILKLYHSKLFQSYPKLEENLDEVRELRNVIAHSRLDVGFKFVKKAKDQFRFDHYKNGKKESKIITREQFRNYIKLSSSLVISLIDIEKQIVDSKS